MDDISLLRRVRSDVQERTGAQVAQGRSALLDRINHDGRVPVTVMSSPAGAAQHRARRARWVGVAVAGAAAAAVATAIVLGVGPGRGGADPAAASVLESAAATTLTFADPVLAPGEFLLVDTVGVDVARGTLDGDEDGSDLASYLETRHDELYVPADRSGQWVWVRHARVPTETFGVRSEQLAAQAGSADVDQVLRLPGGVAAGGGNVFGYQGSDGTIADYSNLPMDPRALLDRIYSLTSNQGPSRDGEALVWIADALRSGTVPAAARAAMYNAAALIPGVTITAEQTTLNGTTGIAVGRLEPTTGIRQDLILDPATGQFLGERQVTINGLDDIPSGTVIDSTAVTTSVVTLAP